VARDLPHVDEVGDPTVRAMRGAVDNQLNVELRIALNQRLDDWNRAVVRVLDAENELNLARVILIEISLDVL
jgi:hypothetical protein